MPKRRGTARQGRSKGGRSGRGESGATFETKTTRLTGGFPDSIIVHLRYDQSVRVTSSTAPTFYMWRGNGPYDPDFSGTGVQPNNYDDWAVQYNRYRVISSRARITTVLDPALNASAVGVFGVCQTSSTALIEDAASQPRNQQKFLLNQAGSPVAWNMGFSTAQVLGRTPVQVQGDNNLMSLNSSVPTDVWYWRFGIQTNVAATSVACTAFIRIEYTVQWFDRLDTSLDLVTRAVRMSRAWNDYQATKKARLSKGQIRDAPAVESKGDSKTALQTGGVTGGQTLAQTMIGQIGKSSMGLEADEVDVGAELLSMASLEDIIEELSKRKAARAVPDKPP